MLLSSVILTVVLGAGVTPHAGRTQTDETVPVQRGARLLINNFAGDVIVHAWDKDSVHVTAHHQSRTSVSIRPTAGGLTISSSAARGPEGSVDYDISAPAWMAMRIEGTYNFVTVEGAQGEVFASTSARRRHHRGRFRRHHRQVRRRGSPRRRGARQGERQLRQRESRHRRHGRRRHRRVDQRRHHDERNGCQEHRRVHGQRRHSLRRQDPRRRALQLSARTTAACCSACPSTINATFTIRTYQGSFSTDLPLQGVNRGADIQRGSGAVTTTLGTGSADVNLETFGGSIRLRKGSAGRAHGR